MIPRPGNVPDVAGIRRTTPQGAEQRLGKHAVQPRRGSLSFGPQYAEGAVCGARTPASHAPSPPRRGARAPSGFNSTPMLPSASGAHTAICTCSTPLVSCMRGWSSSLRWSPCSSGSRDTHP
jgi:hypothetical protein